MKAVKKIFCNVLGQRKFVKKIKNNLEKNDGHYYDSEDTYSRCINAVKNHVKDVVI